MTSQAEDAGRPNVPYRSWVFVVNNYSKEEEEVVRSLVPKAVRLACGREVGESGTPHLQGYVRFEKAIKFSGLKKLLPRANLQLRRGSESQASKYALKDGNVLVDHGVDHDRGKGEKRSREEECDEIIEEIEKGETYGRIRNRHKRFCFWNRKHVIGYMYDERKLTSDSDWDPSKLIDLERI